MAKARSRLTDYVLYLGFRFGACVVQALPMSLASWLFEALSTLVFHFNRRHREVAIDNLRHAFPGKYDEQQLRALALKVYQHFASILLEVLFMPRKVTNGSKLRYIDYREYPPMKEAIDSGRPVIVLTAHYGNWELSAHCLGLEGIHSHLVARPLDNPYLDRWLRSIREKTGHEVLSKSGDIRRMAEALLAKETLCTLGDQDAGERGQFVNFFGRPASTHKVIAKLAERTGAIIVVVGFQKTGGLLEYIIRVMDIIRPEEYAGRRDATHALTQRFTTAIEQMVRLDPVQYFWLHRRWKHQPPAVAPAKAA